MWQKPTIRVNHAVIYRGTDNHIHELSLYGVNWSGGDLSLISSAPAATGDPMAYVRSDATRAGI